MLVARVRAPVTTGGVAMAALTRFVAVLRAPLTAGGVAMAALTRRRLPLTKLSAAATMGATTGTPAELCGLLSGTAACGGTLQR